MSRVSSATVHRRSQIVQGPKTSTWALGTTVVRERLFKYLPGASASSIKSTALNWFMCRAFRSQEVGEAANGEEQTFKSKDDLQHDRSSI